MRRVWLIVGLLLVAGCTSGDRPAPPPDGSDGGSPAPPEEQAMDLTSPDFEENGSIPIRYTCDGQDISPSLDVSGTPAAAESLALIVDDPDAPRAEPWVHWLIWDIPAEADTIAQGYPPSGSGKAFDQAKQGTNSFSEDNQRYRGPCPPPGDEAHRYRFTLHALDTVLELEEGASRDELEAAMDGHVIAEDRYVGLYARS